jgi:hypothetical protein
LQLHFWHKITNIRSRGRNKGFSSVVGAVFMVLIIWVVAAGYLILTLSQNTSYNEVVRSKNQLEADRLSERLTASNANYTVAGNVFTVEAQISNEGPLLVALKSLWVLDNTLNEFGFNDNINTSLGAGSNLVLNQAQNNAINVTLSGPSSTNSFSSWFVTARGNTIPLTWYNSGLNSGSNNTLNVGNLTQIMGDFIPDYHSVQWAQVTGNTVGSWNNGWIIPSAGSFNLIWRINMTYYGNSPITLDRSSMLFFTPFNGQNPGGKAPPLCYIVAYDPSTSTTKPYDGNELTATHASGGFQFTLYFGSPDSPGLTGGMKSSNIPGNLMSITILGMSPSNYAQSFPLFAVASRAPVIELSQISGNPGTTVIVTGTGFAFSSTITVKFDGTAQTTSPSTITSSSGGSFTATFTIPFSTVGDHTVKAIDASSNQASATFTVIPSIMIFPTSGPVGTIVTVSGQGFAASSKITITYDGAQQTTSPAVSSNTVGSFISTAFAVPPSSIGGHMVSATDSKGNSASATFTVAPSITLSPTAGPVGTIVTVSGSSFAASSNMAIEFDGNIVANTTTTPSGSIPLGVAFNVPTSASGGHMVSAIDDSSDSANALFTVTAPLISLSPTSGPIGTTVTASGSNFVPSSTITITFGLSQIQTTPATVTASNVGSFSASFTVPSYVAGNYVVSATDNSINNNSASVAFTITPTITVSPTSGIVGTTVTVSGSNFVPSSTITITYNGIQQTTSPPTVTSTNTGSFTATFTVPATSNGGSNTVTATDASSNSASATFTATATSITITSSPTGSNLLNIDGNTTTTPAILNWAVASTHILQALSPATGPAGTQYVWTGWSNGGAQNQTYTVPGSSATVTASYKTQYWLTVNNGGHGTVSGQDWYDVGNTASFSITPTNILGTGTRYIFTGWTGTGVGSYTGSASSNSVTMSNPITETANWITQYQVPAQYSTSDGSTPSANAVLSGIQSGSPFTLNLTTSSQAPWLDAGTNWSVNASLPASPTTEKWITISGTSGSVSASTTINPMYYHQYKMTLSYLVTGGGSPSAPAFAANQYGSWAGQTLTTSATVYWFDSGSPWNVTNPLIGSIGAERWQTSQTTTGTISSSNTIAFTYNNQYLIAFASNPTAGGATGPPNGWYNAGSLSISATPNAGYKFASWSSNTPSITFSSQNASTTANVNLNGTITANLVPDHMSIDGVGYVASSTTGPTLTLTTTKPNDVIILQITYDAGTQSISPTDAAGLTWNERSGMPYEHSQGNNHETIDEWWAVAFSPLSSDTISLNGLSANTVAIAFGIAGANTTSPFDSNLGLPYKNGGGSSTTPNVPNVSTSNTNDMILGLVGYKSSTTNETAATGYTLITSQTYSNLQWGAAEYQIVSGILSGQSVSCGTNPSSSNWAMIVDAVKQAS